MLLPEGVFLIYVFGLEVFWTAVARFCLEALELATQYKWSFCWSFYFPIISFRRFSLSDAPASSYCTKAFLCEKPGGGCDQAFKRESGLSASRNVGAPKTLEIEGK